MTGTLGAWLVFIALSPDVHYARRPIHLTQVFIMTRYTHIACAAVLLATQTAAAERATRDLQGIWTGGTLTPLERPPDHADKPLLTQAEMADQQRLLTEKFWASGHKMGEVGRDNDAFLDDELSVLPTGQTSLIVDPPDGHLPLRPEIEARRQANLTRFDSYETMSQWDRCISRGPTELFSVNYNNAYQIIQTDTHVVIHSEMIHEARIIPLQGAHADARVRGWNGDSRGHWEGDTLVVESSNFNGKGWIATGRNWGRLYGVPSTEQLRITERFTRMDAKTLRYQVTVEDPEIYTAPWTLSYPLTLDNDYRIYEYACHEGNQAIELILRGARTQERAAGG